MRVLLVTNDFPPKVGGIQVVQAELFREFAEDELCVLASGHPGAPEYDAQLPYRVERLSSKTMLPVPRVVRRFEKIADSFLPDLVIFGSVLPLSLLAPVASRKNIPFVSMAYGADISVPGRLPVVASLQKRVFSRASGVVALGPWVAGEVQRAGTGRTNPEMLVVCPGVDTNEFCPGDKTAARLSLGLHPDRPTVSSLSRLVPRKGMHLLFDAVEDLLPAFPDLQVVIGGIGRSERRLQERAAGSALAGVVRFFGRVPDEQIADFYRAADVFAMLCHDRWRGLEAEGFGIVFVEASACGVPVVAGRSGGAGDAVEDGVTGRVVNARDTAEVVQALGAYLDNPVLGAQVGEAGRSRVEEVFRWDAQRASFVDWLHRHFSSL